MLLNWLVLTASALTILLKIQSETTAGERDLNDAMERLGDLGRQIEALKTKRANNSLDAARAEETATMARDKADEAKEVCGSHLRVTECCVDQNLVTLLSVLDPGRRAVR